MTNEEKVNRLKLLYLKDAVFYRVVNEIAHRENCTPEQAIHYYPQEICIVTNEVKNDMLNTKREKAKYTMDPIRVTLREEN